LLDFGVADLSPETIRTEKQNVRFLEHQRFGRKVWINVVRDPYCGRKNMSLRMAVGVFGKDGASLKKARNQGVVASEQAKAIPSPEQI
jgi:hypothetical protein